MKHNKVRNHWRGFEAWTSGYRKRHDRMWLAENLKAKKAKRWNEHLEWRAAVAITERNIDGGWL